MVKDPALFAVSVILALYAVAILILWAFNIKSARISLILTIALIACVAAGYMLAFAVRW